MIVIDVEDAAKMQECQAKTRRLLREVSRSNVPHAVEVLLVSIDCSGAA
jgi:hypothetical protein